MDNHATTRVDPRVLDAMLPYFGEQFGNAGSTSHRYGWEARDAVDRARESIAVAIGAEPREIVFTSGATESNNLALRGVVERAKLRHPDRAPHIISVATEHKAILDPLEFLAAHGCEGLMAAGRACALGVWARARCGRSGSGGDHQFRGRGSGAGRGAGCRAGVAAGTG